VADQAAGCGDVDARNDPEEIVHGLGRGVEDLISGEDRDAHGDLAERALIPGGGDDDLFGILPILEG
jgi:hypothetical protein